MSSPAPSLTPSVYSDVSSSSAAAPAIASGPSHALGRPPHVKRRSTGTISSVGDGLGYYFSNSAGLGPASSSSASSISLSSSIGGPMVHSSSQGSNGEGTGGMGMVGSGGHDMHGSGRGMMKSQSHSNLKEILQDPQDAQDAQDVTPRMDNQATADDALPLPRAPRGSRPFIHNRPSDSSSSYSDDDQSGTDAGPSARRMAPPPIQTRSYPHGGQSSFDSPSSLPSQYSMSSNSPLHYHAANSAPAASHARSPVAYSSDTAEVLSPMSDDGQSFAEFRHLYSGNEAMQRGLSGSSADGSKADVPAARPTHSVRGSVASAATERPGSLGYEQQHTPRNFDGSSRFEAQAAVPGEQAHRADSDMADSSVADKAPPMTPDDHKTVLQDQVTPSRAALSRRGTDASSMFSVETDGHTGRRSPSPSRSPALPPRSRLRGTPGLEVPAVTSPLTISPRSSSFDLPYDISTARSTPIPTSSPLVDQTRPRTHTVAGTVPVPRPVSAAPGQSSTISDLTAMLGGAIDEIGLIDSRDTPPPTVLEPHRRDKPANLNLAVPCPAPKSNGSAEAGAPPSPLTPRSLPSRDNSLSATQSAPIQPQPDSAIANLTRGATEPRPPVSTQHTQSSVSISTDALLPSARPWPQAMMFGNIKNMRSPSERAMGYAKAINELARAESGLCGWCIAAAATPRMPLGPPKSNKLASVSALGYSQSPSTYTLSTSHQPRNVSTSSEFPMREDSYTAKEISARELEPSDRPSALPPLPYPQLQQPARLVHPASMAPSSYHGGGGGGGFLRPSPSMQSVASVSTVGTGGERVKKGFFSGLKKSGKKDSISLGPPGVGGSGGLGAQAPKKDVRGLPISAPSFGDSAARGLAGVGGVAGPKGPRGSYTPSSLAFNNNSQNESRYSIDSASTDIGGGGGGGGPNSPSLNGGHRASIDGGILSGYTRHGRGSFESVRTAKSGMPPPAGPLHGSSPLVGSNGDVMQKSAMPAPPVPPATGMPPQPGRTVPGEHDVNAMADILPHVEKSVLRAYIGKYGDQMAAIGAYLEDEQRGAGMR